MIYHVIHIDLLCPVTCVVLLTPFPWSEEGVILLDDVTDDGTT